MALSHEQFNQVVTVENSSDSGAERRRDITLTPALRKAERDVRAYFAFPEGREDITHFVFVDPNERGDLEGLAEDSPIFAEILADETPIQVDLGEHAALDDRIHNWIRACEKEAPEAAFNSMYRVLCAIEGADSEGRLSIEQHTRIVRNAAGAAVNSSMKPAEKFIALAGLLQFVGETDEQYHLIPKVISPAMQEQMAEVDDRSFCTLLAQAYMARTWLADAEIDPYEDEETLVIDGVAVVCDCQSDVFDDFNNGLLGGNRANVRKMLFNEFKANPQRLLPLLEAGDSEPLEALLWHIGDYGDITEGQEKSISNRLRAQQAGLPSSNNEKFEF